MLRSGGVPSSALGMVPLIVSVPSLLIDDRKLIGEGSVRNFHSLPPCDKASLLDIFFEEGRSGLCCDAGLAVIVLRNRNSYGKRGRRTWEGRKNVRSNTTETQ